MSNVKKGIPSSLFRKGTFGVTEEYDFSVLTEPDTYFKANTSASAIRQDLNMWCAVRSRGSISKAKQLRRCFIVSENVFVPDSENLEEYDRDTDGRFTDNSARYVSKPLKTGWYGPGKCYVCLVRALPNWAK
jgi:hypothetical protein